jgi:hypothetical protein
MKMLTSLVVLVAIVGLGYLLWAWRQRWLEHRRASEERLSSFLAQAKPQAPAAPADATLPMQRLLWEAGAKAAEAGEPVLAIQLYVRLIARYPDSALGAQARAAVEAQKKKLAMP